MARSAAIPDAVTAAAYGKVRVPDASRRSPALMIRNVSTSEDGSMIRASWLPMPTPTRMENTP